MSEYSAKQHEQYEALPPPEWHEALPDAAHAEKLRPGETNPLSKLKEARETVKQQANQDNPVKRLETAESAQTPPQPMYIDRKLRSLTLQQELNHLRHKLALPDRLLSKVIHQPAVRKVSEAAGQSLTRPSGLLGGGLVAFLGSCVYLYLAKHLGFTYNYGVFLLLLVSGFVIGVTLEILVWAFTRRQRRQP